MYNLLKGIVLRFVKVPPEPADPMGDTESLIVFRAAPNYYKYKFYKWLIGNIIGAIVWIGIVVTSAGGAFAARDEPLVMTLITLVSLLILISYPVSLVWSYVMMRLDYEMRWYKVTDRSLRIREGVMRVQEMTMMFDNIQNITITQGPLQRALRIADLKVQTAGGGGAAGQQQHEGLSQNMHLGYFRGVENHDEILSLMQQRLRAARTAGLGDEDDEPETAFLPSPQETIENGNIASAARELLEEVRAFRQAAEKLG